MRELIPDANTTIGPPSGRPGLDELKRIHPDELPERCRRDIRRFFQGTPQRAEAADAERDPAEYIILAGRVKGRTNYSKWQTSFLKYADLDLFRSHHRDYARKFYRVAAEDLKEPGVS